jgi:hypothetical protein
MPVKAVGPSSELRRLVRQRLHAERLVGTQPIQPEAVVRWLGAVQSQDYAGAKWAVAQRTRGCTDATIEAAIARGAILRTHVMRPTWHFVAPADIRWLLQLTAPRVHALSAAYHRKLGLDEPTFARGNAALAKALQGGHHLTRDQLGISLRSAGVDAGGARLGFLILRAELDAVLCSGPRLGKQISYAAFDERVPATPPLRRDEALAALTRRYFFSHGPARPQDFAWWSGLKVADAVAGIALLGGDLARSRGADQSYWLAATATDRRINHPTMHLLPNFDEYVVAFRDHTPIFEAPVLGPRGAAPLGPREGLIANHLVVLNGQVAGGWRRTLGKDEVIVEVKLSSPFDDAQHAALEQTARRYGRFLGLSARLVIERSRRRSARRR